jgi:hypothetical protein
VVALVQPKTGKVIGSVIEKDLRREPGRFGPGRAKAKDESQQEGKYEVNSARDTHGGGSFGCALENVSHGNPQIHTRQAPNLPSI